MDIIIYGNGDFAELMDYYFTSDSDYNVLGFCVEREYMQGKTFSGKPLVAFEEVESVYLMAGAYDFALIVRGETMQDIAMFVAKKLSTIDGVLSTGTHFIMRRYKDRGMNLIDFGDRTDGRNLIL